MKYIFQQSSILFLVTIIFSSCVVFIKGYNEYKSAQRFHKERNYHQAALYASKSLKLNAKNKKALNLFEKSYRLAVEEHKSNIMNLETIEDDSKWPRLYYAYNKLQILSDELVSLQPIIKLENVNAPVVLRYETNLPIQDYNEELNRIGPLAAQYEYNKGLEYRAIKDKESQKKAAKAFKSAQQFVPNYKNSKELYNETRTAALITILILPFDGNQNLVNYIRDQMMTIQTNKPKEFLQIITRDHLNSILLEQKFQLSGMVDNDQIVEIGELAGANQILTASLQSTHRPSEIIVAEDIKQEKKIVVRKEKYVDDNGVEKTKKIKENVYATIDRFTKSAESNLILNYQITDLASGLTIYSGTVKTNAKFFNEWATYEGDKRALSSQYERLVGNEEKFAPSRSELFMQAAETLPNKLMEKIFDHYSN